MPEGDPLIEPTTGGPDDVPADDFRVLTQSVLRILACEWRCGPGTRQGVHGWEPRTQPQRRRVSSRWRSCNALEWKA